MAPSVAGDVGHWVRPPKLTGWAAYNEYALQSDGNAASAMRLAADYRSTAERSTEC